MNDPVRRGLVLAALILLGWVLSLALLLPADPLGMAPPLLLLALLVRTLLHTGLFIVAHDAMHGSLLPGSARANRWLGGAALLLYAALPYGRCRRNHALHHGSPGTRHDPDHHGGRSSGALAWYGRFMAGYLCAGQLTALVCGWGLLTLALLPINPRAGVTVLLFCTLPLLLSSLQLFVVGTFLPHRGGNRRGVGEPHEPISLDLPVWLSLLSCYHFGYHREHHAFPQRAWHELPAVRRRGTGAIA